MRSHPLAAALLAAAYAGSASAHGFSLTVTNQSSCGTGNALHSNASTAGYPDGATCFENSGLNDTNVAVLVDSCNDTDSGSGAVSLENRFDIDAAVAVDAFIANNEHQQLDVSYDLSFQIDTDGPADPWTLSLDHQALGLLALHGDGTLSAVGTQDDGHAHVSAITLSGDVSLGLLADSAFDDNPSNTGQSSQAFSASANDVPIAAGSGDATVNVTIEFRMDAFSNDGCSGFICSSITGGEEAAVLFGIDDASGLGDVDADEYSEWGRAPGPDGYSSVWTLDVMGASCGNGSLEGGEECDDGNTTGGDGCSESCADEVCGDGVLQPGLGELCDDGNTTGGDGCSATCAFEPIPVPSGGAGLWLPLASALLAAGALRLSRSRRS